MNFLASLLSVLGGTASSVLGLISSTMQSGFKAAIQFHKEGIAFARDAGLSAKEAQAYTDALIERTQVLANKYGVAAEQVNELQRNISVATSRQLMLNNAQAEQFLQLNKLVGSNTVSKFTEEMANGMGGSLDSITGAVSKAYASAAKSGLNAQKVSEKIASNLSMANRLSFRNGIDGLTRMAIQAEKLGISMSSVESAANQFMDLDKSIENAASLQMLGGSVGLMGGNPLTMAYEANYDPEAFAKRMSDALASYATFDKNKGVANINGGNMMFIREIAKAMGIGAEEASRMAKKRAEVSYKEQNISGAYRNYLTQEQMDFLINKSNIANGKVKFTTSEGKEVDLSSGQAINPKVLEEMMKYQGMSDRDIMEEQAKTLTSIDEKITGAATKVSSSFAKGIDKHIPEIGNKIQDIGDIFSKYAAKWGDDVGILLGNALSWVKENAPEIKKAVEGTLGAITTIIDWVTKIEKKSEAILAAITGWLFYKSFQNYLPKIGGGTPARSPASGKPNSPNGGGGGGGAKPNTNPSGGGGTNPNIKNSEVLKRNGVEYTRNSSNGKWYDSSGNQAAGDTEKWLNRKRKNLLKSGKSTPSQTQSTQPQGANPASTASQLSKGQRALNGAKAGVKGAWPAAAIIAGLEAGASIYDYWGSEEEILKDPRYTKEEKKQFINAARKKVSGGVGGAIGGGLLGAIGGGAAAGAAAGLGVASIPAALIGAVVGAGAYWLGSKAGSAAGEGVATSLWDLDDKELDEALSKYEKHVNGGIIGGNSYSGDKITGFTDGGTLFGVNSGEMVLNKTQQANLFYFLDNLQGIISSTLTNKNDVKAKPVGEKEYIYIPKSSETSNVNGNTITVKDFNINLSGTLKLDGGNNSKNVDVGALLNDRQFINNLKELIKNSINEDMNGGRLMNDRATLNGQLSTKTIW